MRRKNLSVRIATKRSIPSGGKPCYPFMSMMIDYSNVLIAEERAFVTFREIGSKEIVEHAE